MLFKKDKAQTLNQDEQLLIENMRKVASGDFSKVDVNAFANQETGELFNAMLTAFKQSNNSYVMRMNDSMSYIANSEHIMSMIEQLREQNDHINDMYASSEKMQSSIDQITDSIKSIKDDTHAAYLSSGTSVDKLQESIDVVKSSTENISQINTMIQSFQEKTAKVTEIADMVKKIASKSGLLALNASIEAARAGEAGRGFAIVANQVKELSSSTTESAEDIVTYIAELQHNITELVESVNSATAQLESGNHMVENSVCEINQVNNQIASVTSKIDHISDSIHTQSDVVTFFVNAIKQLYDAYQILSDNCTNTGEQMYKITRLSGKLRSDMARNGSSLYPQDWIQLYEIDHLIFTWRIYNYLAGYEVLNINQVNTTRKCNLGKWIYSQTDSSITSTSAFHDLTKYHEALHDHAVASFNATSSKDRETAMKEFNEVRKSYDLMVEQLHIVADLLKQHGETAHTDFINNLD